MIDKLSVELAGLIRSSGENDWIRIEQKEIPESQQVATEEDFNAGIRQLVAGESAHTAFTGLCPVIYSGDPGTRSRVGYDLIFYVHYSEDVSYELEVTKKGELLEHTGPTQGVVPQGKAWIIDNNKTQPIEWRPYNGAFRDRWEIGFLKGVRITSPFDFPDVKQDDGFLYLTGDAIQGSLYVSGLADCDEYRVRISQDAGTNWEGELYASVYWPAGLPRAEQKRIYQELFIPECVKEAIEKCKGYNDRADLFFPPIHYNYDACTRRLIGKTPNT